MLSIDIRAKTAAPARWTRPALLALILAALLAALLLAGGGVFAPPPPANALVDGDSHDSGTGDFLPGPPAQGGGPGSPEDCEDDPDADCEGVAQGQGGAVGQSGQAQSYTVALTVSNVTPGSATLNIANHDYEAWYFKETSSTPCTDAKSAGSVKVTGLTGNTTYTYSAYSNNGCTNSLGSDASASFKTLPTSLTVSLVRDTTATLTIAGHTGDWYYQADAGPHNSCASAGSGVSSVALTGLSSTTAYAYTAYSDSACSDANKLATSAFTTEGFVPECDYLTLDLQFFGHLASQRYTHYVVGNRTGETLANVKVVVKSEVPVPDDSQYGYVGEDGLRVNRTGGDKATFSFSRFGGVTDGTGFAWVSVSGNTTLHHWLVPTLPTGASVDRALKRTQGYKWTGVIRDTVTLEHRAPGTGEALCRTERVFWIQGDGGAFGQDDTYEFKPVYGITELSVDNRFPAAGGAAANFKVAVEVQGGFNVNARVRHTPGLNIPTNPLPVITPAPTSPRTLALAEWKDYDATKGTGDFYIGSEEYTPKDPPTYEITLPLQLKTGEKASGQCVTVTLTGIPEAGRPYIPYERGLEYPIGASPYDDPSDNAATLCLGQPPAPSDPPAAGDVLPVLLTEGRADLLTMYGCVGKTVYPCDSTDTVELVIGGGDAAANAGLPYEYFQPEDVIVHIDDIAGRNKPDDETGIFWWSGSDVEKPHSGGANHGGILPGVAAKWHFECLTDKDPNTSPDDDPEYKSITIAIADIKDGQSNTIDHTPSAMIIGNLAQLKNRSSTWVDVDGSHGNKRSTFTVATFKPCGRTFSSVFEFGTLGTYKADITNGTKYQGTGGTETAYSDTRRYTFHVGPVAELSVADRGVEPAVSSGQAAYTLDLTNHGPDAAAAKVVVELPAGATGVTTVPAGLGTFLAAGTTAGVAHGPYWIWDAGEMPRLGDLRGAGRPQNRAVSLIVSGVTSGDATATVSNGNGACSVTSGGSTTVLTYVIWEADCKKVTGAAWKLTNPYKVCVDADNDIKLNVYPNPFDKATCEGPDDSPTGKQWHEGTVLDHRQGNNTATLTARTSGAGLRGRRRPIRPWC